MKISYDNIFCYCIGCNNDEIAELTEILSFVPRGNRFLPNKFQGKRTLFQTNKFPTGLLSYVKDKFSGSLEIEDIGPALDQVDMQEISLWDESTNSQLVLRDYQQEAIDAFIEKKRGIIKLATRSGKTPVAIAISQKLNRNTLFVTGTKDLLYQTVKEYQNKLRRKDIGVIGDGKFQQEKFTVGIINSLVSLLKKDRSFKKWLAEINVVVFDECHHASKLYRTLSNHLPKAKWRLGLSATPLDRDREGKLFTLSITGPIIYEIKMKKLVEDKHIAKPIVNFINISLPDNLQGEFNEIYYDGIVNNEERNIVIAIIALKELKKGYGSLILIEKIDHGYNIENLLKDRCKVKFIHGSFSTKQRIETKKDFESGAIDVLITSRIFNEGITLAFLENLIVAGGYKSAILVYQRNNRGSTKTQFKETTRVWDFTDEHYYVDIHGNLKPGFLYKHGLKRMALVKKEKAFEMKTISVDDI